MPRRDGPCGVRVHVVLVIGVHELGHGIGTDGFDEREPHGHRLAGAVVAIVAVVRVTVSE